jgi:hypothetical protein
MDKINPQKRLSQPVVILGISFLVVACFYALLFVYPCYRSFSRTRQDIFEQTAKLEGLKILYPVYAKAKILERISFDHQLPFPERKEIHRNELVTLSKKISDIAQRNQMTLSGSDFDINALKNESRMVSLAVKLTGEFFDFRRFLIDIIAFEFFDSIQTLSVRTNQEQMKIFTLNLNLLIQKNPS